MIYKTFSSVLILTFVISLLLFAREEEGHMPMTLLPPPDDDFME